MAWPARARRNLSDAQKVEDFLDKLSDQDKCSDGRSALPSLTAWNLSHAAVRSGTQRAQACAGDRSPRRPQVSGKAALNREDK